MDLVVGRYIVHTCTLYVWVEVNPHTIQAFFQFPNKLKMCKKSILLQFGNNFQATKVHTYLGAKLVLRVRFFLLFTY